MGTTVRDLIRKHRHAWRIAVHNPLVCELRDGTIEPERVARWIVGARARLDSFFPLLSRLLASAPAEDREVLIDVLSSLLDELRWLDGCMASRHIAPDAPIDPVVRSHISYHATLALQPYAVGLVAFLTDFRVFADAWTGKSRPSGRDREISRHYQDVLALAWQNPLEKAANRALASATPSDLAVADEACRRAIEGRLDFWTASLS